MASGDINRDGGSANRAGGIQGTPFLVQPHTANVHALTAVRDSTSTLKLISWGVLPDGTVDRKKDSGTDAGKAADLSLARVFSTLDFYVTAVKDSHGNEKLISWRLGEDGAIGRAEDSGNSGLDQINDVSVIGCDDFNNVITGVWDANKKLKIESWRLNQNGQFSKRGDSANRAGEVQAAPELVALPNGVLVSAVVTKESTLKLISWKVENDGDVKRLHDSKNEAGKVNSRPAAVVTANGMIVTALADSNSNLKLICWQVDDDGSIHRRGDSGTQAGKVLGPRLSIARTRSMYVTAVMDSDSKLKLISWSVSANGSNIQRKGDFGNRTQVISEGPAIHPSNHSNSGFITAMRANNGVLKVVSWTVEPF